MVIPFTRSRQRSTMRGCWDWRGTMTPFGVAAEEHRYLTGDRVLSFLEMMAPPFALFTVVGILAAMDARKRGFSPFLWFMGGPFLVCGGYLVEMALKPAILQDGDEVERRRSLRIGNAIGCAFGCFNVLWFVLTVCVIYLGGLS